MGYRVAQAALSTATRSAIKTDDPTNRQPRYVLMGADNRADKAVMTTSMESLSNRRSSAASLLARGNPPIRGRDYDGALAQAGESLRNRARLFHLLGMVVRTIPIEVLPLSLVSMQGVTRRKAACIDPFPFPRHAVSVSAAPPG